ncbi:probable peptidoglycan muropeptide transporter SLC46 [Ochlerotatus camptorhynchus]|uniref:probable peptidoglycan muropeptide transporter SLC46 n=1 Tax=Ochlerotatus camptorhynchus TaxID=644619 RepID=UPI0031DB12FE
MTESNETGTSRLRKLLSYVTIEPVIIFFIFGVVTSTGLRIFELEKACVTKLHVDLKVCEFFAQLEDNNVCESLPSGETLNRSAETNPGIDYDVQNDTGQMEFNRLVCTAREKSINEVTFLNSYRSIITGLVQTVVLLFAGSWSDRVGLRKPCILIPIAADIISTCVLVTSAIFMQEISLEVTGILPNLINSISGGTPLVVTGIYSYLTVCSTEEDRTFRFACAAVVIATIPILASFFSGYLFKALGFINLCLLCIVTDSIGLLYGLFVLKEPSNEEDFTEKDGHSKDHGDVPDDTSHCTSFRKLFDVTLVIDCIKVVTRKRNFNVRAILLLTLLVFFINFGAAGDVESALNIAIYKFSWISNLGTWVSYDYMTTLLGTLLAMGVLSKRFGVSDFLICVFSVCFTLVAKPIMAYAASAVKPYLYYVATSIDVFEGSKFVAIRSIVSKLVDQDEIGKILAILGIVDSTQAVIFPTLYSAVYLKSQEVFIGSVFLLSEAFLLVSVGLYISLYFMSRKLTKKKNTHQREGVDNAAMEVTSM